MLNFPIIHQILKEKEMDVSTPKWKRINVILKILTDHYMGEDEHGNTKYLHHWFTLGEFKDRKKSHLYLWIRDHYQEVSELEFGKWMQTIFDEENWGDYTSKNSTEIMIQMMERTVVGDEIAAKINYYPAIIPFKDRYYNYVTQEFIEPTPQYYFTAVFETTIAPGECPMFHKFLDRILPRNDQLKVLAFLAYCLTPRIDLQMCQIWTGDGKNGKTELVKIFDFLMPKFVSHISLDKMAEKGDRFTASELLGMYVNQGSEVSGGSISAIDVFKRLITNEFFRIEGKYQAGYTLHNMAKHLYDVNNLPTPSIYMDNAFFERLQIIEFNAYIPPSERVADLMKSIWEAEAPQIMHMLVSMLDDLTHYIYEDGTESERLWNEHLHSTQVFFSNYCEMGNEDTACELVFADYLTYCEEQLRKPCSKIQFGRLLKSYGVQRYKVRKEKLIGYTNVNVETVWVYNCSVLQNWEPRTRFEGVK